jgi:hypothetical protein
LVALNSFGKILARRLSRLSRYADRLVQYQSLAHDPGLVLQAADAQARGRADSPASLRRELARSPQGRRLVLLNGNLNYSYDVEALLGELWSCLGRRDRLLAVVYNPYWAWLHRLSKRLGLRSSEVPWTFLTYVDVANLASLAGFELLRRRPVAVFPFRLGGLGSALNAVLEALPGSHRLSFATLLVLRPVGKALAKPSLSIVIPARDERGNIEPALRRLPRFCVPVEVVFVEGHSSDGTWEEIQRVKGLRWKGLTVKALRQGGRGKADAVREGFQACSHDLLTVLDADLTMPPELLPRFYQAYASGKADFINGTRLVYPMEGEAMRFLNWLGNVFFAKALSFTLDCPLGDSLCGTKLFSRADHAWMSRWNQDFGRFDPFGDYEMLFPAAELGLGTVDVPIRYRDRSYGSTKIHRFRDGFILLRMTVIGLWRIRLGAGR